MPQPLQLEGLIQNAKPQGEPFGVNQTRYAFADLIDTDGYQQTLMFVNRDVLGLEGHNVLIVDTSENGEKIKYEMDGKGQPRYRIYGTKVSIQLEDGTEVGLSSPGGNYSGHDPNQVVNQQPAQRPAQRQAPQRAAQQQAPAQRQAPQQMSTQAAAPNRGKAAPLRELVEYGLSAVNYARSQGEDSDEVLASIYGSAMYAFKEGRPACPVMNHTGIAPTAPPQQAQRQQPQAPPRENESWPADEIDAIPTEWDNGTGEPY